MDHFEETPWYRRQVPWSLLAGLVGVIAAVLLVVYVIRLWNWSEKRAVQQEVIAVIEKLRGMVDIEGEVERHAPKLSIDQVHEMVGKKPNTISAVNKDTYKEEYRWDCPPTSKSWYDTPEPEAIQLFVTFKRNKTTQKFEMTKAKVTGDVFSNQVGHGYQSSAKPTTPPAKTTR